MLVSIMPVERKQHWGVSYEHAISPQFCDRCGKSEIELDEFVRWNNVGDVVEASCKPGRNKHTDAHRTQLYSLGMYSRPGVYTIILSGQ
jgi:hypothetical protein